mmetsp:Transcript_37254/g.107602  ORF Transcript_37254/g.107602 Transcript_37254/m.107602 type:complete len:212 (+) Transcript_37254:613-1248(+)
MMSTAALFEASSAMKSSWLPFLPAAASAMPLSSSLMSCLTSSISCSYAFKCSCSSPKALSRSEMSVSTARSARSVSVASFLQYSFFASSLFCSFRSKAIISRMRWMILSKPTLRPRRASSSKSSFADLPSCLAAALAARTMRMAWLRRSVALADVCRNDAAPPSSPPTPPGAFLPPARLPRKSSRLSSLPRILIVWVIVINSCERMALWSE